MTTQTNHHTLSITDPQHGIASELAFDRTFGPASAQSILFTDEIQPLCDLALHGDEVTVLVMGAMGSGKTFSMLGRRTSFRTWTSTYEGGIIDMAIEYFLEQSRDGVTKSDVMIQNNRMLDVQLQVLWIEHDETVRDVFGQANRFEIRPPILTATQISVTSVEEASRILLDTQSQLSVHATSNGLYTSLTTVVSFVILV